MVTQSSCEHRSREPELAWVCSHSVRSRRPALFEAPFEVPRFVYLRKCPQLAPEDGYKRVPSGVLGARPRRQPSRFWSEAGQGFVRLWHGRHGIHAPSEAWSYCTRKRHACSTAGALTPRHRPCARDHVGRRRRDQTGDDIPRCARRLRDEHCSRYRSGIGRCKKGRHSDDREQGACAGSECGERTTRHRSERDLRHERAA